MSTVLGAQHSRHRRRMNHTAWADRVVYGDMYGLLSSMGAQLTCADLNCGLCLCLCRATSRCSWTCAAAAAARWGEW